MLTRERIGKFIRKTRDYKMTYLFLVERLSNNDDYKSHSHDRIEGITKLFKQHRSALDSDYTFILNS